MNLGSRVPHRFRRVDTRHHLHDVFEVSRRRADEQAVRVRFGHDDDLAFELLDVADEVLIAGVGEITLALQDARTA